MGWIKNYNGVIFVEYDDSKKTSEKTCVPNVLSAYIQWSIEDITIL